jgi:2-polyprenyl-3-methyl-5-hydroxy-6-metoxy-1,4-benzoquinol methylase
VEVDPSNAHTIDAYSRLTDADFDAVGAEGDFGRRTLLNPTIFRLLGDVRDQLVLDAGCGHGYLSRLLAERGATVVGIEPAAAPFGYATRLEREHPRGITYLQRDLSVPGPIGGPFDAVVANMVFLDIPAWRPAMRSCVATLKPGGVFIYSLHHPLWVPGRLRSRSHRGVMEISEYLNEHVQEGEHAPNFHRTLSTYVNETIQLGCAIIELVEPQLRHDQVEEPTHEVLTRIPNYIVVAARRHHEFVA